MNDIQKDPLIYLNDMLFSIDLINQYVAGLSFRTFDDSYDIQDKVMRRLEIIAIAAKKLPDELRNRYSAVPWKSIIGLRNIIAHSYDEINLVEVWEIITKHLQETENQLKNIKTDLEI